MSVASSSTARRLTADRRQEIRDAFNLFDVDGVGLIPVSELEYALKALGVRTDATEIAAMVERIEARQEAGAAAPAGMITFAAFLACATDQLTHRDHEQELRTAFRMFNDSARGGITLARLSEVAREMGEDLTAEDLQLMIDEADRDHDGVVSETEFLSAMRKAASY